MLRLMVGIAMLALVAGPALAQQRRGRAPTPVSPEEIQKKKDREAIDKQYQDALKRTDKNAAPAKVDPWANMRGDNKKP